MSFATDLHKPGSRSAIAHDVLLLVEGYDIFAVAIELLRSLGLEHRVEVRNGGGKDDLTKSLRLLPVLSGFAQVVGLGVIRDCEDNPKDAFQSVQGALQAAGFSVPKAPRQFSTGTVQAGVFLLPDERQPGMLESLLWKAIASDPTVPCIDDFLKCVVQKTGRPLANIDKSRVYAYIAGSAQPHLLPGQAARAGYFPWASVEFDELKAFLLELASKAGP